ncbi:hypothetical protein AB1E22_11915 [Buttiauxella gaviniae]|uniref:Uncharacterized protein n=1 Tax=Buttiauxella gaviniae TaxID=82990 RepID=A0ABV3NV42_9ENTR
MTSKSGDLIFDGCDKAQQRIGIKRIPCFQYTGLQFPTADVPQRTDNTATFNCLSLMGLLDCEADSSLRNQRGEEI